MIPLSPSSPLKLREKKPSPAMGVFGTCWHPSIPGQRGSVPPTDKSRDQRPCATPPGYRGGNQGIEKSERPSDSRAHVTALSC